ncbi:MAG: DNA repair protein RecN, partial [Bdellovibrionales bacterium]|nr:DNA repair protein RecN [Bdellovibrionales bacterium]
EEELESRFLRAKNSTRLAEFANQSEEVLYGDEDSALVRIHRILQKGFELSSVDEALSKKLEPLSTAKTLIEETVYELREYGRGLEFEPSELRLLEERMSKLRHLTKKYGGSVAEMLERLNQVLTEIDSLENFEESLLLFEQQKKDCRLKIDALAEELHQQRVTASSTLKKGVNAELLDLNMKGVVFGISIEKMDECFCHGASEVEFTIQMGAEDKPRPLAKYASGGELSRILLAIKRVVGLSDLPRTYLFDEVDAGVSGMTAEKVGRKLRAISKGQQIICVTHLPQVAAFADHHFFICKQPTKTSVEVKVMPLNLNKDRIVEIARLISGEKITKSSRDHARQLLQDSAIN